MKWYLVVYEASWHFDKTVVKVDDGIISGDAARFSGQYFDARFWNDTEKGYFSRIRSKAIQAESKIDAFNRVSQEFKNDETVIHIEELD